MILGIDIDDTITETTLTANKYITLFDNSYKDYHDLSQNKYFDFLNLYLQDIVKNNILKEGVKEAFEFFKNKGYKIIFITARNDIHAPNIKKLTKEFLDKNNIYHDKLIYEEVGHGDKSALAKENSIDIFIDDKEDVLDKIASSSKIECIRFTNDKKSKYKTFNNWYDIIEYIKTK
ncbi:MAG: hypothetical protein HFI49_02800 [Bacilli bacterium]|jgi:uncharacterized HAD superfamily protein|nr:hypothetical protein [Bacilli bacterium]